MKDVLLLVGAGQLGMAIARRIGFNHKILIGDKNFDNAIAIADTLEGAGFDVVATEINIADKTSILSLLKKGKVMAKLAYSSMPQVSLLVKHLSKLYSRLIYMGLLFC